MMLRMDIKLAVQEAYRGWLMDIAAKKYDKDLHEVMEEAFRAAGMLRAPVEEEETTTLLLSRRVNDLTDRVKGLEEDVAALEDNATDDRDDLQTLAEVVRRARWTTPRWLEEVSGLE